MSAYDSKIQLDGALAGSFGTTLFDDTTSRSGNWVKVVILEDSTSFTTLTDANRGGTTHSSGVSYSAGTVFHGTFTVIKLAAGACLAYKAVS
jgi:hypothetical protein